MYQVPCAAPGRAGNGAPFLMLFFLLIFEDVRGDVWLYIKRGDRSLTPHFFLAVLNKMLFFSKEQAAPSPQKERRTVLYCFIACRHKGAT